MKQALIKKGKVYAEEVPEIFRLSKGEKEN